MVVYDSCFLFNTKCKIDVLENDLKIVIEMVYFNYRKNNKNWFKNILINIGINLN